MSEFFAVLANPALPFIRYAVFAGLLSSISFGVIGSFVVVKRISYIAGAVSHAALGGIGAALFFQQRFGWTFFTPVGGAILTAFLAGGIISVVNLYWKQREDTIIGIIWSVGMAAGLLFIAKTPGYIDPMSYLFGNILLIGFQDLMMILALDVLVILTGLLFYNQLLAVSFDEDFAKVRGLNVWFYQTLLIMLTALTVVLMVTLVGIVMVIALLTLPAAVAGLLTNRLKLMMLLSSLACMLFTFFGLALSYSLDAPSGAVIILVAAATYLGLLVILQVKKSLKRLAKRS